VIDLDATKIAALPIDELGLVIVQDLHDHSVWNESNYLMDARHQFGAEGARRRPMPNDPRTRSTNVVASRNQPLSRNPVPEVPA
jgi:hypothetical protein